MISGEYDFNQPQNDKNHIAKRGRSCTAGTTPYSFAPAIKAKHMEIPDKEDKFTPSGAMAFFVLLILLSLAFWYGIYLLMIDRT